MQPFETESFDKRSPQSSQLDLDAPMGQLCYEENGYFISLMDTGKLNDTPQLYISDSAPNVNLQIINFHNFADAQTAFERAEALARENTLPPIIRLTILKEFKNLIYSQ